MKRLHEHGKTALICVLILLALWQTLALWDKSVTGGEGETLKRIFGEEKTVYEGTLAYEQFSYALDVMEPLTAAVRNDSGLYATPSRADAGSVFDRVSALLAEGLESADAPVLIPSEQWQQALDATMVLLDFGGNAELATLAYLLGAGELTDTDITLRWLVLSDDKGLLRLCMKGDDRSIYSMTTRISSAALQSICSQYEANGAFFAYEKQLGSPREVLLVREGRSFPMLRTQLFTDELTDAESERMTAAVLEGFSFNAYTVRTYTESDGARVYVEGEKTLRMTAEGAVSYTDATRFPLSAAAPDTQSRAASIGQVSRLAASILSPWLGDVQLFLQDARYDPDAQTFTVELGLSVQGNPVVLSRGFALRAVFRGGRLVEADLNLRSFRLTEPEVSLLPAVQALAACSGARGFGIYYVQDDASDDGLIIPDWHIRK